MSLCSINFFGSSIGLSTSMNVILPDSGDGPFPVFYLLHGLSDDHTIWLRRTSIERYVAGLPLIVVMPNTHRGFYTNGVAPGTYRYEDHLIKDVIGLIDRTFPTIKSRQGRAIGGLSMGGYGAAKLGLKHPDLFCSVNSHSGALNGPLYSEAKTVELMNPEFLAMFGKDYVGGPDDPHALAKKCPAQKRPAMLVDCGTEDFLLEENRAFRRTLQAIGYPHEYQEFPGAHEWGYWDLHVQQALAFHRKQLGI